MELKKGLDMSPCDRSTVGHRGGEQLDSGLSLLGKQERVRALSLPWGGVGTQGHHQRAGYQELKQTWWGCRASCSVLPCLPVASSSVADGGSFPVRARACGEEVRKHQAWGRNC